MHRLLLRGLTLLSLLLFAGAAALLARSYRGAAGSDDHVSFYVAWRGGRHTVRAERGKLTLYAPPVAPALHTLRRPKRRDGATAEGLVPKLSNDQVEWEVMVGTGAPVRETRTQMQRDAAVLWTRGHAEPFLSPRLAGEPAGTLLLGHDFLPWRHVNLPWFPKAEITPPLLRALENPDQFLAAHVALLRVHGKWQRRSLESRADGTYLDDAEGLKAVLTPVGKPRPLRSTSDDPFEGLVWPPGVAQMDSVELYSCSGRVEPGALRTVRDRWHRLLDVEVRAVPLWPVLPAAAVLPLARWCLAPLRRRTMARMRRRRGMCPDCGYDLRATPGQCPECGAAAA